MSQNDPKPVQTYETYAKPESSEKSPSANEQLLARVLGETMFRRDDDPKILFDSLRGWRSNIDATDFDLSVCEVLVLRVLSHRLGSAISEIPMQLYREVAESLWDNPESRTRVERIWNSLAP